MDKLQALQAEIADYIATQKVTGFQITANVNIHGPDKPVTYEGDLRLTLPDGGKMPSNYVKFFAEVLTEFADRVNVKVLEASKAEAKARLDSLDSEADTVKQAIANLRKL